MRAKKASKGSRPKPSKATVQLRVDEILRIRLDGAELWDVREYVREQEQKEDSPWKLAEGDKPLSDSQIARYIQRADMLVAESCKVSRKKLFRRHLAQRRNLYAKAVSQGDMRTALACVRDEAELLGLYPEKKANGDKAAAGVIVLNIVERLTGDRTPTASLEHLTEKVITAHADTSTSNGTAAAEPRDMAAPGPAGLHAQ
jgi:hypothetical protein